MRGEISEEQKRSLLELIAKGEKGEAVRRYRQLTHKGAMDAAQYMEDLAFKMKSESAQPSSKTEIPAAPATATGEPESKLPEITEGQRQEIVAAILRQDRFQAIQRYRELTGASARDAVWYVEALAKRTPAVAIAEAAKKEEGEGGGGFLDEEGKGIVEAIYGGNEVQAVALCRELTGLGLKEARKFIERLTLELYVKHPDRFRIQAEAGKPSSSTIPAVPGGPKPIVAPSTHRTINTLSEEQQQAIILPILEGRKLRAIEAYREITGAELSTAIKEVEKASLELRTKHPEKFKARHDEKGVLRASSSQNAEKKAPKPAGCALLLLIGPALFIVVKVFLG